MPLAEAARALHTTQRGSDIDCLSRGLSDSDDGLLIFWARRVAQIGIPVYGRRIMSTRRERVPLHAMATGRLLDHMTRLEPSRGQPLQDFCTLQVLRRDLHERISEESTAGAAA